jgi:hypothetical protein
MSLRGHVWTASWQGLSDVQQLVGCGHVSGLLVRHGGSDSPNALRGSGPNLARTLECDDPKRAADPRNDRICITSS